MFVAGSSIESKLLQNTVGGSKKKKSFKRSYCCTRYRSACVVVCWIRMAMWTGRAMLPCNNADMMWYAARLLSLEPDRNLIEALLVVAAKKNVLLPAPAIPFPRVTGYRGLAPLELDILNF